MDGHLSMALAALLPLATFTGSARPSEPTDNASPAPRFEPAPCGFADVPADWAQRNGVTCGWVRVPAQRDRAGADTLKLWVVNVVASGNRKHPPVIRVMGGPEPIRFAYLTGQRATRLRQNHDVIFFDYRGLGRSEPALSCQVDPVRGATMDERLASKLRQYASCREQIVASGIDLSVISSRANAHDIDDIARALGHEHYYLDGFSYGSVTMLELMRTRPDGLRGAFIGTPFAPDSTLHDTVSTFAQALARMQEQCSTVQPCAKRFPDMAGSLGKAMDRMDREQWSAGGRRLLPADLFDSLWTLMVAEDYEWVPLAIDAAAHGDAKVASRWIAATLTGGDFFLPELTDAAAIVAATVNCTDIAKGASIAPDLQAAARLHPYLAKVVSPADGFDRLCATWGAAEVARDARDGVASDLPMLVASLRFDPATTPADARLITRLLPHATLLEHPGGTHMTLPLDPCLIGIETAFFADPQKPLDRSCTAGWKAPAFRLEGFPEYVASSLSASP